MLRNRLTLIAMFIPLLAALFAEVMYKNAPRRWRTSLTAELRKFRSTIAAIWAA